MVTMYTRVGHIGGGEQWNNSDAGKKNDCMNS
jgi:hypothetical protein